MSNQKQDINTEQLIKDQQAVNLEEIMTEIILDDVTEHSAVDDYGLLKMQADARFDQTIARVTRIGQLMNWRTAKDNKRRETTERGLAKIYGFVARFQP